MGKTALVFHRHVNAQYAVEQHVEKVYVVADEHTRIIAVQLFGGKTHAAHKSLPQAALSLFKFVLVYI